MGALLRSQGKLAEAEPYFREATEKLRATLGDEHAATIMAMLNLGGLLQARGQSTEAIALLVPAEPPARRAFTGSNVVRLGRFLTALGRARAAVGQFDSAEANLNEAYALLTEATGAGVTDRDRRDVLIGLVELYAAWHAAQPDLGQDANAAEWRARLTEWQASTQPAVP
jgi:non-specific serine/threonine protein kinase/serine/threonine-protein kinase